MHADAIYFFLYYLHITYAFECVIILAIRLPHWFKVHKIFTKVINLILGSDLCYLYLALALAAVQGKPDKPLLRRGQQGRQNRQLDTGNGAPDTGYGAPALEEEVLDVRSDELATYAEEPLDTYSDLNAAASDLDAKASDDENDPLAMLMKSVPGTPGEDYPIFSEAPETAFSCEGQVNGGKVG